MLSYSKEAGYYLIGQMPAVLQGFLHLKICLTIKIHRFYIADAFGIGGAEQDHVRREVLLVLYLLSNSFLSLSSSLK